MKTMIVAVALLVGATARGDALCQTEKNALDRALERSAKARQALADYDSSPLAPVVEGQADKERQQLQDNIEAAYEDVKRASDAHSRCVKRRTCKKPKGGWSCTVAWTYEKCCLDKKDKDKGKDARH